MSALDDLCQVPFHAADDAGRAAILRLLADTTLYVALASDPRDDAAELMRLPLDDAGNQAALACDDDGKLAETLGRAVAHVTLPGREVARMLAGQSLSLLVNPGAPSAMLLDAAALGWLSQALSTEPEAGEARLTRLAAPDAALAEVLAPALGARLAEMPGLAREAMLIAAEEETGNRLHLVVLIGTPEAARPALAKAVAELIAFMPPLPQSVDVSFADDLPIPAGAVRIRLEAMAAPEPVNPATEPAQPRPPRLR